MSIICKYCKSENVYYSKKKKIYVCEDCEKVFQIEKKIISQKIFLSYGHDENTELVEKIYKKLLERGHVPWIDKNEIKAGDDWRRSIIENIMDSKGFLAFISNYSVRVPGVCLDEIAIGVGNWNCKMQPIVLEKGITPPSSINNIQWIDMSEWKQIYLNSNEKIWDKWFDEKMQQIFEIIENKHSRIIAGNITNLEKILTPVSSSIKMKILLSKKIVGRKWLIDMVHKMIIHDETKAIVVYGSPGMGKSVISAYICNFSPSCIGAYFCEWNNAETKKIRNFIYSIIFQLACNLEDYQMILMKSLENKKINKYSEDEIIQKLLYEPLNQLIDGDRDKKILIIDAIDEMIDKNPQILDYIVKIIENMPSWIKIIITSRPEMEIIEKFQLYQGIFIDKYEEKVKKDIREYVKISVKDERMAKFIIDKSKGSFVYAKELIKMYENNKCDIDLKSIPDGVGGIYYSNFDRIFQNIEEYNDKYRPFFEILIVAQEQISREEVMEILEISQKKIEENLRHLHSYVYEIQHNDRKILQVFHKSFLEWLTSNKAGKYKIEEKNGHRRYKDYLIKNLDSEKMISLYMVKYAFCHIQRYDWEEIECAKQKNILDKLIIAADLYGILEQECTYISMFEKYIGRTEDFYVHAIEYYKKISGEKLIEISQEALRFQENIEDEEKSFRLICQIAFAYFYVGYAKKSYELIKSERKKHMENFWNNEMNNANYWRVIAVSAHDLDNNKDVVQASLLSQKAYRSQKKFYDQYISMINLFDGYMALGELNKAEKIAKEIFEYLDNRYYIHVDDILQICYANLLQTEGRIMESLVYYEKGLSIAKKIQSWDYIYGSIWRELAIAQFGDESSLSALQKYREMARNAGYLYLVSLADCFFILAGHFLEILDSYKVQELIEEIDFIGMPGHALQAKVCCKIHNMLQIDIEEIVCLMIQCEGVKGYPQIISEYYLKNIESMNDDTRIQFDIWCTKYVNPIINFQEKFLNKNTENLETFPLLKSYNCRNCQAKCCYDGAYLLKGEEEKIQEFVNQYPEYFKDINLPFIVDGDWKEMESERKTNKQPFNGYDNDFPEHFTKTRCVFAMENGECSLQRVATDLQLHPWKIKPRACWSFPIGGVCEDEIIPPPLEGEKDPDYLDENYPGYTSFLPCAKQDYENGEVWYKKYKYEVEYYRYLIREKLLDK